MAPMITLDDRILEHVVEENRSSPRIMSSRPTFTASRAYIRERWQMLVYAGFLAPFASDMYVLTTSGRLYLDGEIDAAHQPRPSI